jgi:hypothetical protein
VQYHDEVRQYFPSAYDTENEFVAVNVLMDSIRQISLDKYYGPNVTLRDVSTHLL